MHILLNCTHAESVAEPMALSVQCSSGTGSLFGVPGKPRIKTDTGTFLCLFFKRPLV